MSKYSQGRSTRCTCSRDRHSAGSIEDVCPRRNKDIKLWVQNSWLIAPSLPSGRLTRKLDKICSNFFKSIFGKNDFFSKKHCFIQSRCISKLFYLIRCLVCNLYGFLKLLYIQEGRFLENIYRNQTFISFSIDRYKICKQKDFPRVFTAKHTIEEGIYTCSQAEPNPMSSSKKAVSQHACLYEDFHNLSIRNF